MCDHPEIFKDVKLPFNGTSQAILITVDERNEPSFVRELIQKYPDQKWMIRLHPTQKHLLSYWESQLKDLGEIDVRLSTLAPLEVLWSQVQTHLSAYSSVAIEAAMNGVKTYFWSPLAKEMYPNLFSQNYAYQWDGQISAHTEKNNFKMIVTNDWRTWCKQHLVRNI